MRCARSFTRVLRSRSARWARSPELICTCCGWDAHARRAPRGLTFWSASPERGRRVIPPPQRQLDPRQRGGRGVRRGPAQHADEGLRTLRHWMGYGPPLLEASRAQLPEDTRCPVDRRLHRRLPGRADRRPCRRRSRRIPPPLTAPSRPTAPGPTAPGPTAPRQRTGPRHRTPAFPSAARGWPAAAMAVARWRAAHPNAAASRDTTRWG